MADEAAPAASVLPPSPVPVPRVLVAVPVPGLDPLTYAIGEDGRVPVRGARVVVPLGSRVLTGVVLGAADGSGVDASSLKRIRTVLDNHAFVPPDVIELAAWTAEYYLAGIGETIVAAL